MAEKVQFLNSRDVAYILDCSPEDVIDLARREKLKAVKQGHYWRFRLADVQAYKRKHTEK